MTELHRVFVWYRWFAWYPVTVHGNWRWFRWVERRKHFWGIAPSNVHVYREVEK